MDASDERHAFSCLQEVRIDELPVARERHQLRCRDEIQLKTRADAALAAWIGLYSPFSNSHAPEYALSCTYGADPSTAHLCFSTEILKEKNMTRCIPRTSSTAHVSALENSVDFNAYEPVTMLPYTSDLPRQAALLFCKSTGVLVISFPFGVVRTAHSIASSSAAFLSEFHRFVTQSEFEWDRVMDIVLCGHSEGGAGVEAIALELAMGTSNAETWLQSKLDDVFVMSSGAHLWMTAKQLALVADVFRGRVFSFVLAWDRAPSEYHLFERRFDGFCAKQHWLDMDDFFSMPKTALVGLSIDNDLANVEVVDVGRLQFDQRAIRIDGKEFTSPKGISAIYETMFHAWDAYEEFFVKLLRQGGLTRDGTCNSH